MWDKVSYYVVCFKQIIFEKTQTPYTYLSRISAAHLHRWWLTLNEHPCPSLTITSIRSASLTCLSAVCPLTHSSPWLAPEQSKACDNRLACRHSTHSQTPNPMIQAGTRLFPASVSSLLYTLGSANGEQMQEEREAIPTSRRQTAHHKHVLCTSQWPVVLQKHVRHLARPPFQKTAPSTPNKREEWRPFST